MRNGLFRLKQRHLLRRGIAADRSNILDNAVKLFNNKKPGLEPVRTEENMELLKGYQVEGKISSRAYCRGIALP